jgi:hypothetical protein
LVVPRRFESGIAYKRFHTELAKTYSSIELVALPEVFNYSDAVTTLIIASGHRTHSGYVAVKCQQIEKRQKEVSFESGTMTSTETVIGPSEYSQPNFSLWIPPLSSIWRYTGDYPQLSLALTQWHRGIQWKPATAERGKKVDKHVSVLPKNGYVKGFVRAEDKWQQYYLDLSALKYLSIRPQDQTRNSYKDPWERPKVVCNASRLSRSQWRVGAVVDERGFAFSSRFVLFWPEKNVSLYAVAALLNSPLSNAFLKAKESGSLNRLVTLGMLPIPSVECLHIGGKLDSLSRSMHAQMAKRSFETANDTLLHIDAEILRAYDLPPRLEYELLASFQDLPRPVAFEFTRYYPDNFDAYISLHELISPEFENARADRLLQRLTLVDDPEITKALAQL